MESIVDDYERYKSLRISLLYEKDICKYILDVFTKPGMVITADRLYHPNKPHSVGKFLVLSDQMINSAESVKVSINELTGQREGNVGDSRTVKKRSSNTLFYMAQYGGSKTQFFAYLMDVISSNHPNVLFIKFDNLNSIQPNIIYDQLISQIYKKIVINSGVKYE